MKAVIAGLRALVIVFLASISEVQSASYEEHVLKAAFLYNFADFISWPENGGDNGNIEHTVNYCVIGAGIVAKALSALIANDENPLIARQFTHLSDLSNLSDLSGCHVLFLESTDDVLPSFALESVSEHKILTVSDSAGFISAEGMIEMVRQDSRIEVHLNIDKLDEYGFKVSSQLMRLAIIHSTNGETQQ